MLLFFFWFSLLTLLWAGRRPFLFGRRWFRLDGGSCWANAESREGGGSFFLSLSLCCGVEPSRNLICFVFFDPEILAGLLPWLLMGWVGQGWAG